MTSELEGVLETTRASPTPASPPMIFASGLVKRYDGGRIAALNGLYLEVAQAEFVAICGPSGCGKTTLLNVLSAIDRVDAGIINVCGQGLSNLDRREADRFRTHTVGLVFQLHNLLPSLSAIENVQVPLMAAGVPPAERVVRARELLERVGLGDRAGALPPTLSGGERQRVAIARALANRPRVLLADEPTGALDSRSGEQLYALLAELQRDLQMTLIVVTHDAGIAERAGRVLHMLDGRIEQGGGSAAAETPKRRNAETPK